MQGRQFRSVPVSQWLCAVGSWVLGFVSMNLVSVVVQFVWFVGRWYMSVPMVISCFVLHQYITSLLVSGAGISPIIRPWSFSVILSFSIYVDAVF